MNISILLNLLLVFAGLSTFDVQASGRYRDDDQKFQRVVKQKVEAQTKEEEFLADERKQANILLLKGVENHDVKAIETALDLGADINFGSFVGTPLVIASMRGYTEIVEFLIKKKADINLKFCGETALMYACNFNRPEIVNLLLELNAKVDIKNNSGETALMICSNSNKRFNMMELLIKKNAKIDLQDLYGYTALMNACRSNQENVVKLLLDNNANVNIQNESGQTALMIASDKCYHDIVKSLLDKKADANLRNKLGETALMIASKTGCNHSVDLLLNYDASNIDFVNNEGDSAFAIAVKQECSVEDHHHETYLDILTILLRNGAIISNAEMFFNLVKKNPELKKAFEEYQKNVDIQKEALKKEIKESGVATGIDQLIAEYVTYYPKPEEESKTEAEVISQHLVIPSITTPDPELKEAAAAELEDEEVNTQPMDEYEDL